MTPDPERIVIELRPRPSGWSWEDRLEAMRGCLENVYRCRVTIRVAGPARMVLELEPVEVTGWPWYPRLRQMLKTIGRMYKCRATIMSETFPPATEPASEPKGAS